MKFYDKSVRRASGYWLICRHRELKRGAVSALCLLCSVAAWADSSYQVAAGIGAAEVDVADQGDGEIYSLDVAAYLRPVRLDGSIPYALAPFYKRVPGLFMGAQKEHWSDLNQIIGGRILKKSESSLKCVGVRFAQEEVPYWVGVDYTRVGAAKLDFTDGTKDTTEARSITSFTAGWFVHPDASLYALYRNDELDSYGAGFSGFLRTGQYGFIGGGLGYERFEQGESGEELSNNTIRILGGRIYLDKVWSARMAYYPTAKIQVGAAYHLFDYTYNARSAQTSLFADYYVLDNVRIGAGYRDVSHNQVSIREGRFEYNTLDGHITVLF